MAEDAVEGLRAELAALRKEVRTRRVVVVDAAGRPRIVLSADPGAGSVRLDADDGAAGVEIYAVDTIGADGPEIGIALVVAGTVVDSFHLLVVPDR